MSKYHFRIFADIYKISPYGELFGGPHIQKAMGDNHDRPPLATRKIRGTYEALADIHFPDAYFADNLFEGTIFAKELRRAISVPWNSICEFCTPTPIIIGACTWLPRNTSWPFQRYGIVVLRPAANLLHRAYVLGVLLASSRYGGMG